jgi:hypothetical protein
MSCPANIDSKGVLARAAMGLACFALAFGAFIWLESYGAPKEHKLVLFPLLFAGCMGYLQAKKKVCVVIAQTQDETMRKEARKIVITATVLSVFLTAASFFAEARL